MACCCSWRRWPMACSPGHRDRQLGGDYGGRAEDAADEHAPGLRLVGRAPAAGRSWCAEPVGRPGHAGLARRRRSGAPPAARGERADGDPRSERQHLPGGRARRREDRSCRNPLARWRHAACRASQGECAHDGAPGPGCPGLRATVRASRRTITGSRTAAIQGKFALSCRIPGPSGSRIDISGSRRQDSPP